MTVQAKILVVGRSGQVASALQATACPRGLVLEAHGRPGLDLRVPDPVAAAVSGGSWAAVVNAAAYTDVERAESEPDAAFALNRDGPAVLAEACARAGIPLIHLSTDYVFDGAKPSPYDEDDPVEPLSVYGASKAAGEEAIRTKLDAHVILRTSWVFSPVGTNFVKTMLGLARKRDTLRIVNDQSGCPTSAQDIGDAIMRIMVALLAGKRDGFGTFHFANLGATTWHDFADELFRQAELRGLRRRPKLIAIPASAYPAAARRPRNSVLDTRRIAQVYGIVPRRWQDALSEALDVLIGPVEAQVREGGARTEAV